MGSYLNIYLEKKKKEGEEKGERLLLCSISGAEDMFSLFYDEDVGIVTKEDEEIFHKFTSDDLVRLIDDIDINIAKTLLRISRAKELLPLVTDKESINEMTEEITSDYNYLEYLNNNKSTVRALCVIFSDIDEEWCDFSGLCWSVS